ncbi:DUF2231 domain-containing protein [Luteimicrobium subarcticum]|uniref:Putative membrane protein n=1 Tax=Luteimicrobium subarcticum TaxID=620910 RepID=A0A2M8WJK8_9MICO|nr:DUF2231 domain-containing protein [Luteimicrobium subarcticum]PJI91121.1 putative membrane protein [Luteimicrobium subarcticum]
MTTLDDAVARLEDSEQLDALTRLFDRVAATIPHGAVDDLLRGKPLGHALHPSLTDLPIGFWTSATVLDLVGGERSRHAARLLVGLGLLSAAPTALAGFADWRRTGTAARRVGAVHAVANEVAVSCYALSWLARGRGRHGLGVLTGLVGATAASVGGLLGGHLTLAMGEPAGD